MKTKISLFTLILLLAAFGGLSAAEPADAAGELIVIEDDGKTQEVDLSQAKQPALVKAEPMLVSSYMDPTKYTLGPDDVIEIAVQRHPEFSGTYPVNLEGKIQYKFVGDLEVSGMTKTELEKKITEIISAYVINPEINVTILEYKSKVVYILGEVGAPGKYFMRSETIPVREAVVNAGLPQLTAAMRRCLLITPDRTGKAKTRTVDLIDRDLQAAFRIIDNDVGDDILGFFAGVISARLGVKAGDLFDLGFDIFHRTPQGLGNARVILFGHVIQMRGNDLGQERVVFIGQVDLDQQAFRDVPCRHAGRLKLLDEFKGFFYLLQRYIQPVGNFFKREFQIAVFIQAADDLRADFQLRVIIGKHPQLAQEDILQSGLFDHLAQRITKVRGTGPVRVGFSGFKRNQGFGRGGCFQGWFFACPADQVIF